MADMAAMVDIAATGVPKRRNLRMTTASQIPPARIEDGRTFIEEFSASEVVTVEDYVHDKY